MRTDVKAYAGVGSRSCPEDVCRLFANFAYVLAKEGWRLRSGAAEGADSAFEQGVDHYLRRAKEEEAPAAREAKAIFLPWDGFEAKSGSPRTFEKAGACRAPPDARKIAARYHPAWNRLSEGARKLHTRNVGQVLGADGQSPASFLVCWTPDGCASPEEISEATGGTGQALRIAADWGVPVFNAKRPGHRRRLEKKVAHFKKKRSAKSPSARGGSRPESGRPEARPPAYEREGVQPSL